MNRRSFLGNTLAAIGGSLLVGKTKTRQLPIEKEKRQVAIEVDEYGNFIFPGFFTVFVDGQEAFRMMVGDKITTERKCHIVAFNGFEAKPSMNFYLHEGDSLEIN